MPMRLTVLILLGYYVSLICRKNLFASSMTRIFSKKAPKKHEPFDTFAQFLLRFGKESDLEEYTEEEISRAMRSLAKSQSALKTMDGITHQLRNVYKESSSLQSRFEKLLASKRKKLKEAAKVYEYTRTVERGLQSAEIIQSASVTDDAKRRKYLSEAGLTEVKRVAMSVNKVNCVVSVLVPKLTDIDSAGQNNTSATSQRSNTTDPAHKPTLHNKEQRTPTAPPRFHPNEAVVCITEETSQESTNIAQMLRLITRPNQEIIYSIEDDRTGGNQELLMQSTYLAMAHKVLDEIEDCISHKINVTSDAVNTELTDQTLNITSSNNNNISTKVVASPTSEIASAINKSTTVALVRKFNRIRVVGHSAGGAVAALTALVLDGGVFTNSKSSSSKSSSGSDAIRIDGGSYGDERSHMEHDTVESNIDAEAVSHSLDGEDDNQFSTTSNNTNTHTSTAISPLLLPGQHPLTSLYSQRVQCLTLGAPPCMNRAVVPKYITSIVCGDDMIPRAQAGALQGLSKRVSKALKAGAGGGSLGYLLSAGVLKDLSALTRQSLGHYKGKKSTSDLRELCVPGRVFFIKPRKLKEGATIQRVMRGNWQEDMLWQLKEILLSKRMLEHHTLDSYIRTLNRC